MKKTEKIRYEIDPHNRLVYEKTGEEPEVPGFRAVLDGSFAIAGNKLTVQSELIDAKDNRLSFAVLSSQKEVSIAAGAGFRW